MSVALQPEELGFRRPFDHEITEVLKIINTHNSPVAFKVKTTAPKQYCVRPNSGIVKTGSSVEVQVLLQAMKEDPPLDARCRDKFLVQSVAVTDTDEANLPTIWSSVEKTAKSSIIEKKIRVHFLPGPGATPNGVSHEPVNNYGSPASNFGSPAPAPASRERSAPDSTAGGVAGMATAVTSAVSNAVPTSQDDLKRQLAEAQSQINRLSQQMADPQVRQRKVQQAQEKVQTVVQQTSDAGVPLQIVAGLCLVSFIIAYLFF